MNKRIRELIKQCEDYGSWDNKVYTFDKEKFAQLIVRECIAQCESKNTLITTATGTTHWGEISDAVKQIQKHFGVDQ